MMRTRAIVAAAVLLAALTACGHSGPETAPAKVNVTILPSTLSNGSLHVSEDEKSRAPFKASGPRSLLADGRVFTFRGAGDRLVGTLQLSTVRNDVDLANATERNRILNGILTTAESISIGSLDVAQSTTEDKTVYVWFGDKMFQVLQLKPSKAVPFKPEDVLSELITYETRQPAWRPIKSGNSPDLSNGDEEDPG